MSAMLDSVAPDVDFNEKQEEVPIETTEVKIDVPEPKVEAEVKEETKPEEKPQKLVPLEALHESRKHEREWRDKAAQIEKEAQERFQKLEQRLEKLANPPPAVPKFEEDPAGFLQHEVRQTKAELEAVRQSTEQSRQVYEAQQFEQQIASSTKMAEQVFAKDHSDYVQAVQYLQAIADKNLEMMGLEDPVARQAQIRNDALSMSLRALQMGKSPAEVAYQLAVNYGYKASEPPKADAAKKIATIEAGQKTASMPSGGSKQTPLTLAALESMDDDDFNKLIEDDASWRKLVRQMS